MLSISSRVFGRWRVRKAARASGNTGLSRDINGHVFPLKHGRFHNNYFGEELKALHKGGDGLFTVDALIDDIPATIMSLVVHVAPPYETEG